MKDITREIELVASNYHFQQTPEFILLLEDLIGKALRFLRDWLRALHINAGGLTDSSSVSNIMQLLILALGPIVVGCLIYVAWRRLLATQLNAPGSQFVKTEAIKDSNGWRQEALLQANDLNYKFACRSLYLSMLYLLNESKVTAFQPAATNYEYLIALKNYPELMPYFKDISCLVEETWFGNKAATLVDYEFCSAKLNDIAMLVAADGQAQYK